ncbi:unnamed protein product [Cyclocybe aegerita]|uniref:Uncharacterized protein n=1 Tax=Cyclocybe aegerita TaxID=1973307 RepID=A0A8S0WKX0_CYCAE|nr:unnamed protein product [Cyclocybe aegerita]
MPSTKTTTSALAGTVGATTPVKASAPTLSKRAFKAPGIAKASSATSPSVSGSTSDEENVQPPHLASSTPALAKGAGAAEDPIASRPLSPLLSNKDNERDVRAYEHDRQRTKRAAERAMKRAKKAGGPGAPCHGCHGGKGVTADRKTRGRVAGDAATNAEVDADVDVPPVGFTKSLPAGMGFGAGMLERANLVAMVEEAVGIDRKVSLLDFVVTSSRKPRKAKDDDFEFIPPVRSVIVLDDMAETRDMDVDEPWEHVDDDFDGTDASKASDAGSDKDAEPSYAEVVRCH